MMPKPPSLLASAEAAAEPIAAHSPGDEVSSAGNFRLTANSPRPEHFGERRIVFALCVGLALLVWSVFGQTLHDGFVDFDDTSYVIENPRVLGGISFENILWAFSHVDCNFYHPLTLISLMLDHQLYGLNAGGYHLTNVLLHGASAIMLFLVLRRMTGLLWRSAFAASVFAIHPLRVESVAWVAERKDVLGVFFFMLMLWAYVRYTQETRLQHQNATHSAGTQMDHRSLIVDYSSAYYWLSLLFFAFSLLAKPLAVTLPFVLLLLDCWPLQRFGMSAARVSFKHLALEKIPFLLLAAAACVVAVVAQGQAVTPAAYISLPLRIANAVASYAAYLGQMIWPAKLAVFYPHPLDGISPLQTSISAILLAILSVVCLVNWRKQPFLAIGWLWYLGMLVPMSGIVQVGSFARADRYTYLPQIGLYLALTWLVADLTTGWRHRRLLLGGLSVGVLAALLICARTQTSYWQSSESLWSQALACTSDNVVAHNNLATTLFQEGKLDEAIVHFQQALRIKSDEQLHFNLGNAFYQKGDLDQAIFHFKEAVTFEPARADYHLNLGNALLQKGSVEAIGEFQLALKLKPDYAPAHNNLGYALLHAGDLNAAIGHLQQAVKIEPDYVSARFNLGCALLQLGRVDDAILHLQKALALEPGHAQAHYQLGNALLQKGNLEQAIAEFQEAVKANPDYPDALNNLAWALATTPDSTLRNGNRAVELARRANDLTNGKDLDILGTLAAAYAEAGRFEDARQIVSKAIEQARATRQTDQLVPLRRQLELYTAGHPFHEEAH